MRRLSVYCLLQESLYLYLYLFPFSAFPSVSSLPLVQAMGRPHQWEDLQTMIEGLGLHLIRHFFIMFWATVWHCCAHQWNDLASKLSYSVQAKH